MSKKKAQKAQSKVEKFFARVNEMVVEQGPDNIDRNKMSAQLLDEKYSFSMIGQKLTAALREAGIEIVSHNVPSEEIQNLRKRIEESLPDAFNLRADYDGYVADLRESFSEISESRIDKEVKAGAKELGIEVPNKVTLGASRMGILEYLRECKADDQPATLEGCADYLERNVKRMNEMHDDKKTKGKHAADTNFTFAKMAASI